MITHDLKRMRRSQKKANITSKKYTLFLILTLAIAILLTWFSYSTYHLYSARKAMYCGDFNHAYKHFIAVSSTGLYSSKICTGLEILAIVNRMNGNGNHYVTKFRTSGLDFYNHAKMLEYLIKNSLYEDAYGYSRALILSKPSPEAYYFGGAAATALGKYKEAADMFLTLSKYNSHNIRAEEKLTLLEEIVNESYFAVKDRNGVGIAKSFSEKDNNGGFSGILNKIAPLMQIYENDLYNTVILTIDAGLQTIAENTIKDSSGILIALSPSSGNILAITASGQCDEKEFYVKKIKPGFIINLVTSIASYEQTAGKPFTMNCGRETNFNGIRIYGENKQYTITSINDAFLHNCSAAFAEMAVNAGENAIKDAANRLCFNRPMEIGGKNVILGSIETEGGPGSLARFTTGSYKSWITPLHLAMLASTVAAKGPIYKPRIVFDKQNINGESYYTYKPSLMRISAETKTLDVISQAFIDCGAAIGEKSTNIPPFGAIYAYSGGLSSPFSSMIIGFYPINEPKIAFSLIMIDDSASKENIIKQLTYFISEIYKSGAYQ